MQFNAAPASPAILVTILPRIVSKSCEILPTWNKMLIDLKLNVKIDKYVNSMWSTKSGFGLHLYTSKDKNLNYHSVVCSIYYIYCHFMGLVWNTLGLCISGLSLTFHIYYQ